MKINIKKIKCEKKLLWTKKNHHHTIKIFILYKFQRSPAPLMGTWICTTSDKIKRWAFGKFLHGERLVIVIVLVFLYCFETIFPSFSYFGSFKLCRWHRFGVFIVKLEHISHLFLVFTVDFEQLDTCWNWTINVQLQWKLSKADTYRTKTRCLL